MRPEESILDLNNLPDDRDGKKVYEEGSSSGEKKKKIGSKDESDESGKVYECRFCSLKFCKSQALGGHMNRHRQERESETLYRARQLVFRNDNLAAQAAAHFGYHSVGHAGDSTLYRSMYNTSVPRVLFSGGPSSSSSIFPLPHQTTPPPPPPPPPPPLPPFQYTSLLPPSPHDYLGQAVLGRNTRSSHSQPRQRYYSSSHDHRQYSAIGTLEPLSNYTCIGSPVLGQFSSSRVIDRDGDGSHARLDHSPINRLQDQDF